MVNSLLPQKQFFEPGFLQHCNNSILMWAATIFTSGLSRLWFLNEIMMMTSVALKSTIVEEEGNRSYKSTAKNEQVTEE